MEKPDGTHRRKEISRFVWCHDSVSKHTCKFLSMISEHTVVCLFLTEQQFNRPKLIFRSLSSDLFVAPSDVTWGIPFAGQSELSDRATVVNSNYDAISDRHDDTRQMTSI